MRLGGANVDRLGGVDGASSVTETVTKQQHKQSATRPITQRPDVPLLPGGGIGRGGISGDGGHSSSSTLNACKGVFGGGENVGDDGGVGLDRRLTGGGGIGRVMRGGGMSSDVSCSISAVVLRADRWSVSPCNLRSCAVASGVVPETSKMVASCVKTVPCCRVIGWSSESSGEGNVFPSRPSLCSSAYDATARSPVTKKKKKCLH